MMYIYCDGGMAIFSDGDGGVYLVMAMCIFSDGGMAISSHGMVRIYGGGGMAIYGVGGRYMYGVGDVYIVCWRCSCIVCCWLYLALQFCGAISSGCGVVGA
jgi:hypothetical protein